ncbi:hypothetical protein SELR_14500 [Selenomonas ruminantium subsp. lactilytica TAM6421]|uniref:Uncharacterized protein n=1 Tax=Selenomonas ruminantium subsp. lactilytica (strain NBRC 103574 / TAM6421) TaxID=927704 RepID=I0GQX1_SELRL|nr:hypothetical protein SELR_14500 [Selenomonas ruminantium subsp. lactilytica TAM6421]
MARNLLRSAAAGVAQHGAHAREILISMKAVAEGRLPLPILGEKKLRAVCQAFGIGTRGQSSARLLGKLADVLLADLSRALPEDYKTIRALAPKERQEVWDKLDIVPISAYQEVFDAYHRTGVGTDGDYRSILKAFLRCGLAFCFTGVVASNIGTDVLFYAYDYRHSNIKDTEKLARKIVTRAIESFAARRCRVRRRWKSS